MKFDKQFTIEDPSIYSTKSLKIDYSQEVGLSGGQLKKLRREWMKVLPSLDNVEFLFLGHKLNQDYFDAVCSMPNLRGLWIKSSQIEDFSKIGNLKELNFLCFSGSVKIKSLSGIENLEKLEILELNNFFGIETLNEVANLSNLKELMVFGGLDGKKLNIRNLEGISGLISLRTLVLDIKAKGIDVEPISGLKNLEKLIIPPSYFKNISRKELLKEFPKLKSGIVNEIN